MSIRVNQIESSRRGQAYCTEFDVLLGDQTHHVYWKSSHPIANSEKLGDALFSTLLLPAMAANADLTLPFPVDKTLYENSLTTQKIFNSWYPSLAIVDTPCKLTTPRKEIEGKGVGLFFSGGVDSFYTLYKNLPEISHIIFAHGFDVTLGDTDRRDSVTKSLNRICIDLSVELIEIETNLRSFSDSLCPWGSHYFGAALAGVGHLLSQTLSKIYLSCDTTYDMLDPWGSHLLTTPLWSSSRSTHLLYGADASRLQKSELLSSEKLVQKNLRVCWEHKNNLQNCGLCEKCIRTMTTLYVLGRLDEFDCFSRPLTPSLIDTVTLKTPLTVPLWSDILARSEKNENFERVSEAIRSLIFRYEENELVARIEKKPSIFKRIFTDQVTNGNVIDRFLEYSSIKLLMKLLLRKIRLNFYHMHNG